MRRTSMGDGKKTSRRSSFDPPPSFFCFSVPLQVPVVYWQYCSGRVLTLEVRVLILYCQFSIDR